jgi:hypothetical protein
VWTLRTYNGIVRKDSTGYAFTPSPSNPAVPGLRIVATIKPGAIVETTADLTKVHAVPDPYYGHSAFDVGSPSKLIQFVNLPPRAIVRIFTVSGVLVKTIRHDDPTGGGRETWDLRTPNQKLAASGVYYIHVATPDGHTSIGKFTVISPPN